jgi:class 3 adenylate cyclase
VGPGDQSPGQEALPELPAGTVAFLFTDLEGSTRLLEAHPVPYREAVARHHDLLRGAVEGHGGAVFETVGDAVYAAFARPARTIPYRPARSRTATPGRTPGGVASRGTGRQPLPERSAPSGPPRPRLSPSERVALWREAARLLDALPATGQVVLRKAEGPLPPVSDKRASGRALAGLLTGRERPGLPGRARLF